MKGASADVQTIRFFTCVSDVMLAGIVCSSKLVSLVGMVRGEVGGWGRDPKKMYGERLGDGVEYHLMKPTPRR